MSAPLSCAEVLSLLPHRRPFLFVDEILELNETGARGRYRFREDEVFYPGHFPGNPITPGVILIEAMGQIGVVAHGIYLYGLRHTVEEIQRHFTVFSDGEAEFFHMVRPGDEVFVTSEKVFFRQKKIRARVEMKLASGQLVASATLSGIGVEKPHA
ncbi:MAG: 3-hydroxyacyl-ACP dehydratase FabZ family protein [Myxococcota bacterium]